MANVKISDLPAAASAGGTDQLETNQSGTSRRLTVSQVATHVRSTATDTVVVAAGSAAAPSISPTGDSNTGLWAPAADTLAFSTGGTERLRINSSGQSEFVAGSASTPAVTTTGDTNTGMFFPAADQIAFAEGGTEAVRIDASGQVGIGTSTPIRRLTVAQSGSPEFVLQDTSQGADLKNWRVINASQVLTIGTLNDAGTSGVEALVLDRSGNLKFNSGYGSVSTAYAARAWVNFNGQGTVAIRSSGGVSSITDNSNGNYTVNLSFTMPDTNYSFIGLIRKDNASDGDLIAMNPFSSDTKTTTAVQVRTQFRGGSYGYFDPPEVNVAIFR